LSRAFLIPEVLQTSGMDCGPAALKSLLEGLGTSVNYENLREACRTGADGTSIDALEDICNDLGFEAYQEMAAIPDALEILKKAAPAILVVKGPGGAPHFVVLWRLLGNFVQIMDPGRGRRWIRTTEFLSELHVHTQVFDEPALLEWLPSTLWGGFSDDRLRRLRSPHSMGDAESWHEMATLEGGSRLAQSLVDKRVLPIAGAAPLIESLLSELPGPAMNLGLPAMESDVLPVHLRAIVKRDFDEALMVKGCVFLLVRPKAAANSQKDEAPSELAKKVLGAKSVPPFQLLLSYISAAGKRIAMLVMVLSAFLAVLSFAEMFLLRAAFNAQSALSLPQQRLWGTAIYALLIVSLLAVEVSIASHVAKLGRSFELRCRLAILRKLPKLPDKYFRTRPMSDVTHRSQGLFSLRGLPSILVGLTKVSLDLIVTTVALLFLHPSGLIYTLTALLFGLIAPYFSLRIRSQLEHRVQAHASGLSQLYLDVLLGLNPLRTHGGQHAIRARQDEQLVDWREESERTVTLLSLTEGVQQLGTLLAVCAILGSFIRNGGEPGALLVLSFWALKLPVQARALSQTLQRTPMVFASLARLLEPLSAEETPASTVSNENTMVRSDRMGLAVEVRNATAVLGTHKVLDRVSVTLKPGQHVAIVGNSGAGKSSLLAAILGLIELDEGEIRADGIPVARYDQARFRRETVWVDPSVQLWNRSLLDNLLFGNPKEAQGELGPAIERTELKGLLQRLSEGMATPLGESGARVSGGEGQRVRLSRSLLRRGSRLVLLDEAFRGLERSMRRRISTEIRKDVRKTTLIEVTHDVADTQDFDRILVIENGRVLEDGAPQALLQLPNSRYAELVAADQKIQTEIWDGPQWRHLVVGGENGHIEMIDAKKEPQQ
jgi:ABC-type bacteriocin/lantibiotic exporter with double-glycine peptidase domain